jgi:hypothetical protein
LEQEVGKVHRAHEELVQASERRERLERAARSRLQGDLRRMQEVNRALHEKVELLSTQLLTGRPQNPSDMPDMAAENLRKELGKREIFIAQLITQSKKFLQVTISAFHPGSLNRICYSISTALYFQIQIFTVGRKSLFYLLFICFMTSVSVSEVQNMGIREDFPCENIIVRIVL